MATKTQGDIVSQHLQSLRIGEVITNKLPLPNLEKLFVIEREEEEPKTDTFRAKLPVAANMIGSTTKQELSEGIAYCTQFNPSVVGLAWNVGEEFVTVTCESGTKVQLAEGRTEEDIKDIILLVLRSRASVQSFEWDFSKPFIKVGFENRQFA